jgi:dynein heavy chain, axonemal
MNTVLVQEVIRYNRLLVVMKETQVSVQRAIRGQIVMSEELEMMANSLFDNQVPKVWEERSFLSMKPLSSWTEDLNRRIAFLADWVQHGTPKLFWISGFFFPQAFLTGTLQNYARKHVIAIDQLSFEFNYLDSTSPSDIKEKPADGCLIHGMFIEGAKWIGSLHRIEMPTPKELYSDLPLIHLVPRANRATPQSGVYECPVYKVVSRRGTLSTTGHSTNFVMYFEMPTDLHEDIWIRAGVAAFLALRY